MEITIDKDLCIGCGCCYNISDELFAFDDEGKAQVVKQPATDEEIEMANNAIEYCPTSAIKKNGCDCDSCPGCQHQD